MMIVLCVKDKLIYLRKLYYGYMLFVFIVEGSCGSMIHDLQQPVLINPGTDNYYWMLHLLNIPQAIVAHRGITLLFETTLLATALSCFISRGSSILAVTFTMFYSVYVVTKSSFVAHHEHGLVLPLLMSVIFWPSSDERKIRLLEAFRYYVLFAFVSAALWKLVRGSAFAPGQFAEILKMQHLRLLATEPENVYALVISWLISHQTVSDVLLGLAVILQHTFVVGFFTYRADRLLLIFFFLFFIGDFMLMNLTFYQWYIAAVVFLPYWYPAAEQELQDIRTNQVPV